MESTHRYPDMKPLSTLTCLHVLHSGDEVFRAIGQTFKDHKLSQGRFMAMIMLFNKKNGTSFERSPAEIAERINVTRATITGLLDGLERDDLVARTPDVEDRRKIVVNLTQRGIDLLDKVFPIHFRRMHEVMNVLSDHEKKQLSELLGKVCDWAKEITPRESEKNEICSM